jgi:putative ABC transport system permease protein
MTTGAILIGVATVVFALSLHLSLGQVAGHLIRDQYVQIDIGRNVSGQQGSGKVIHIGPPLPSAPEVTDRQLTTALRRNPNTARFVAEAQGQVSVPGIAEPIPFYAYRGASSWIGYALISGRWFSGPGEVVAPTKLIQQANLRIGQRFTARLDGKLVQLRLVGEILDQADGDLLLRGEWATLVAVEPRVQPTDYEVQLRSGVNPRAYPYQMYQSLGSQGAESLDISVVERSGENTTFILFNTVIAGLALVLTAIAVAGVFNTVILTTREKVRDVAILKAVGMAPGQVVTMVVASVAVLGLVAGALGVPVGLFLHRQIIQFMGQIAAGTAIPPSFFDLINHGMLALLALAGVAIAALGAWVPAQWAASSGVAEVLQSE